jgi:hypothetical protein
MPFPHTERAAPARTGNGSQNADRRGGSISNRDNQSPLLTQYRSARDALNASLYLLRWSIDLREQLEWGVFDIDEAKAAVHAFKCACAAHKAGRRRLAA